MYKSLLPMGIVALAAAQSNVTEAPPPAPVLLNSTKSGVIPTLPTGTPFAGVDTIQGAIVSPLPPPPGYTGLNGLASVQSNQPVATYRATLTDSMFDPLVDTVIQGYIQAVSGASGVAFTVNLTNLPDQSKYGPFPWHIHSMPVPSDGNCTATMGHLDPTNRGELYMCDASNPASCQVGDLAGKHGGKIMSNGTFTTQFTDQYLSLAPGSNAFFGGLAFVIHSSNTSRLTCANFDLVSGGNGTTGNGSGTGSPSSTGSNPPESTSNVATKLTVGAGAIAMAAVVLLL